MKIPKLLALITLILASFWNLGAQIEWQKIAPAEESFTVSMPTKAVEVSRLIPLSDNDSIAERVYYSIADGKRYMVVSFIRTTPDRVPALANFQNFMRAIEQTFAGDATKSLSYEDNISDESGIVMKYRLKLSDYSGVARFMGTDKSFYALMVIGASDNDSQAQRFFSSFSIGELNKNSATSGLIRDIPENAEAIQRIRTALPPEPWPKTAGPIIGGVLNGKALTLARPGYPKEARKNHEAGMVKVRVIIDESGNVISAQAIEGPESLRAASVEAASRSRFTPTRLMGQPVKITGVIIYNFVAQ